MWARLKFAVRTGRRDVRRNVDADGFVTRELGLRSCTLTSTRELRRLSKLREAIKTNYRRAGADRLSLVYPRQCSRVRKQFNPFDATSPHGNYCEKFPRISLVKYTFRDIDIFDVFSSSVAQEKVGSPIS